MSLTHDWLAEFRRLSLSSGADAKNVKTAKSPEPVNGAGDFGGFVELGKGLQKKNEADGLPGASADRNDGLVHPAHVAGVPRIWTEGVACLRGTERRNGYTASRWPQLLGDANGFMETWAVQAAALGWSTLDVFGVHPKAPDVRQDCKGLVPAIGGAVITAITTDAVRLRTGTGTMQTYYRRPCVRTVPVWELSVIAK